MMSLRTALFCTVGAIAAPALAGQEVLYAPEPEWVAPADLAEAQNVSPTNFLILDRQLRIEQGRLWEYSDTAARIATPQELTQFGTIAPTWLPDKGDLIVHEVSILRNGELIDVIGAGSRLEILRREQSLEQRILDGQLTATLAVPGLKVGDVLRLRYSTTLSDQALEDQVESINLLFREPDVRPGIARILASWESGADIRFQAGPDVENPGVETRDGFDWLEIGLPLGEADEIPGDAPLRFQRPALLQLGTFSDWREVSRIMAPYYEAEGLIAEGSELAAKAREIAAAHNGELDRAVAALELVQEEIGYLANGLDGGNYIPQSPEDTWSLRYGDCKAKTVLLLALLEELDIQAEAVLVSTTMGDALSELLPMPGVFDHVVARATIDGEHYWLDGTSAGANRAIVGNAPPFFNALPISAAGAGLEPVVQQLPRAAESSIEIQFDQRAGIDIPVLVTSRFDLVGSSAAFLNANLTQLTEKQTRDLGYGMIWPLLGSQQVTGVEIARGEDDSELTVEVTSLMTSPTRFENGRSEQDLRLPTSQFEFAPDRARREWREIPVSVGVPQLLQATYRVLLPEGGAGYELVGPTDLDETVARRRLQRSVERTGEEIVIVETILNEGGELPPEAIASERRKAASLSRNRLVLRAPENAARRWRFAGESDRSLLEPVEAAYTAKITFEPDEAEHFLNRGHFRLMTYDFAGAVEDFTQALDIESSARAFHMRSQAHAEMLDQESSWADLEEAFLLDPTPWRALALAGAMADAGDIDGARALVEEQDGDETIRQQMQLHLAEFDGRAGEFERGLDRIEMLLADRPNDAVLLNAKCWYMGTWNFATGEAADACTRAVENSQASAAALDSRALVHLRNGRLEQARADADAALALAPGQTQTLLLRGLIRRAAGDVAGEEDIRDALARSPAISVAYRHYGFQL